VAEPPPPAPTSTTLTDVIPFVGVNEVVPETANVAEPAHTPPVHVLTTPSVEASFEAADGVGHVIPHPPQLFMSLCSFTHALPHHVSPVSHVGPSKFGPPSLIVMSIAPASPRSKTNVG
jgi:hypothetical protein